MQRYFKTCLVKHSFTNNVSTDFSFNLRDQINTDILYDEIKVNYIALYTANASSFFLNIYIPELNQYIGTVYDAVRLWTGASYSINLEGKRVPQSLTFQFLNNDETPSIMSNTDKIAIMLTFIKN
jgi:hypothetical protein